MLRPVSVVLFLSALVACSGGDDTGGDDTGDDTGTDTEVPVILGIGAIGAQEVACCGPVEVAFTLTAPDLAGVTLTAVSSDQAVLADTAIAIGGTGAARTLTLTPAVVGVATVTVTATDADGSATASFVFDSYINRSAWIGVDQWNEGTVEAAYGLAVGPGGHVWVFGAGNPDGRYRSYVQRRDLAGAVSWTGWHDIALDSIGRDGMVFSDGTSVIATQAKLNPASNTQFVHLAEFAPTGGTPTEYDTYDAWDGASANHTVPGDLAALADGTIAVVIHGVALPNEVVDVRRLGTDGAEVFTKELMAASANLGASAVAITATRTAASLHAKVGRGTDVVAGGWDSWIVFLDATGTETASVHLGTTGDDVVDGLAFDASGNLYACGHGTAALADGHTIAGGVDAWVAKYDTAGTRTWLKYLGTAGDDWCGDIAIGRGDAIYVTGTWNKVGGSASAFVAKLDASGNVGWNTAIDSSDGANDAGLALVHSGRDILVVGQTNGVFTGNTSTDEDSFVARLDESGALK